MKRPTLFATLIGINQYPTNPLRGCVKDVLDLDRFLREFIGQQKTDGGEAAFEYQPRYFLAPSDADLKYGLAPHEQQFGALRYESPTFEHLRSTAFAHLKQAQKGDTVLLYYSGHGSSVPAPEVFWSEKANRQNETLVCVDSRTTARDLIDKELAYLLHDALTDANGHDKGVHCVVVMDCCHAGNNTRGDDAGDQVRYRHEPALGQEIPLEQYLGFDAGFFKVADGVCRFEVARYVHLAAARDDEKAQEVGTNGLFTKHLLESLRAGGSGKSYRALMQSLNVTIRNKADRQNPVAFAREDADLDHHFLSEQLTPYQPTFEVRYDPQLGRWKLFGGTLHGLQPSGPHGSTQVRLEGDEHEITLTEVKNTVSLLEAATTEHLDPLREDYRAVLTRLANPVLQIGLSAGLQADDALRNALEVANQKEPLRFCHIQFTPDDAPLHYLIRLTDADAYVLTRPTDTTPIFKREKDAASFLRNVDSVGKWVGATELQQQNTGFKPEDFVFTLERIEGKAFDAATLERTTGEKICDGVTPLPAEATFSYHGDLQPAMRLSVGIHPDSDLTSCHVGALYLQSDFGITHQYIKADESQLEKGKSPVQLKFFDGARHYNAVPLWLDPLYETSYGLNEITAFVKIFVSNRPILGELERFQQPALELDPDARNVKTRNAGFGKKADQLSDQTDWTVFTLKVRLVGPRKTQEVKGGKSTQFSAFTLEAPAGFEAVVYAATGDDLQTQVGTKGIDPALAMPDSLLGDDTLTDPNPFAKGLSSNADNGVQVLELRKKRDGGPDLQLAEGQELVIRPSQLSNVRSADADGLEECVVPFGYDEQSGLYFPLGYSDPEGNIHVTTLPPPTEGTLNPQAVTKGFGGSVKLFFKKVFRRKKGDVNTLTLYKIDPNKGHWERLTDDPAQMQPLLAGHPNERALLLVHGFTGNTQHMVEALKEMTQLAGTVRFVLSYDYESLSTPIDKTAALLKADLTTAGFGSSAPPLVILAHSMGGLVSRRLVEKHGASAFVPRLILVGSPCGGTEMAKLPTAAYGMLTHALNVTGPVKYAVTGLSFLLKKLELDPAAAVKEMEIGSQFVQDLGRSAPPYTETQYRVLGGDTELLKTQPYTGSNRFLKKVAHAFKTQVAYPALTRLLHHNQPNDFVATLQSMSTIQGYPAADLLVVVSDHLAYFRERRCQDELLRWIAEERPVA